MDIVAQTRSFVIGVDTHARKHVLAVLVAGTGMLVATADFPTTKAGLARAVSWAGRHAGGDLDALWVIEGVASYGAGLARLVTATGYQVVEAPRYNTGGRAGVPGKSYPLDAKRIAAAALPLSEAELRHPRSDTGERLALRVLTTARDHMASNRTGNINALTALVRSVDLGLDARNKLSTKQVETISRWRPREEPLGLATARNEAIRLAQAIIGINQELAENKKTMASVVTDTPAAGLTKRCGIGPVTASKVYVAWSHPGRIRSEAAFAAMAGVSPIPVCSGNTNRYRLNRGGDRQLNRAIHIAVVTRMRSHPETKAYVEKRRAEGRADREISRCLKRYLARQMFRYLNSVTKPDSTCT